MIAFVDFDPQDNTHVLIYIRVGKADAIIRFGWTVLVFHLFDHCKTVGDDTFSSITKFCGKEEQKSNT